MGSFPQTIIIIVKSDTCGKKKFFHSDIQSWIIHINNINTDLDFIINYAFFI